MADCSAFGCDGDDGFAFKCNECGQRFCADHRLPENHRCPALLRKTDDDRKHLETGLADKNPEEETAPKSGPTLAEKQRRSVRRWREEDDDGGKSQRFEDVKDEARDLEREFRDEHLSPREKQIRAQEQVEGRNDVNESETSTSRSRHQNRSSDDGEDLSPREKQIRAQEQKKEKAHQTLEPETIEGSVSGIRFRWATWLYRLLIVAIVITIVGALVIWV